MTISDSNPIQFWDINGQTFNEEVVCGLKKQDCFCQPWLGTDQTNIQVSNTNEPAIKVYDSSDTLITQISFFGIISGVWEAFINFATLGYRQVKFIIGEYSNIITNYSFVSTLSPWTQTSTGLDAWTWDAANAAKSHLNVAGVSETLIQTFAQRQAGTYKYSINSRVTAAAKAATVNVTIYNGGSIVQSIVSYNESSQTGVVHSGSFTAVTAFDRVKIDVSDAFGSPSDYFIVLNEVSIFEFTQLFKSDCQEIKQTQDCTKLITYSNSSNFDGLDYSDLSPGRVFYCRFPAVMYKSKNPKEQEDLELSNGVVVTLRSSIQQKKMFEHGFMPDYMVLKLQKILMHETIIINGIQWKQRDPYDDKQVDKYNLKTGAVLLTKYNSVEKNTI